MNVKLITHTPEPEKVIASAAKLCYSSSDIETLMDGLTPEKTEAFIDKIVGMSHLSPVEHVTFTFGIEGVSRSLTHQLVRHRIASYSQKSQRYVKEGQFEYIIPTPIKSNEKAKELFIKAMENDQKSYDEIVEVLMQEYVPQFLSLGLNEKIAKSRAEKKAIENARYVLPNACETKIIVTMNIRTLYNFFKHRCCNRAQDEIRELADKMLELCQEVSPVLFKNAGASCVNGKCPEGKMTCGHPKTKK